MQGSQEPDGEIEKVAQAGIAGIVAAVSGEMVPPDVMIDAALHILAAWVGVEPNEIVRERARRGH